MSDDDYSGLANRFARLAAGEPEPEPPRDYTAADVARGSIASWRRQAPWCPMCRGPREPRPGVGGAMIWECRHGRAQVEAMDDGGAG